MGINHVESHIFVPFALVNLGIARYNIEGRRQSFNPFMGNFFLIS